MMFQAFLTCSLIHVELKRDYELFEQVPLIKSINFCINPEASSVLQTEAYDQCNSSVTQSNHQNGGIYWVCY